VRLAAIHIDGFGIFHELDVVRLSPGLNVFLGDNESGKTTLLAFLRTTFLQDSGGKIFIHP